MRGPPCAVNVPNYLTISRILSVPLLIWILSTNLISGVHGEKELLAAAVFSLAAITDRLDGYLARKHGLITRVGMLLDPLADKLLIASALIVLVQFNPRLMPAWIAVVVIGREFLVSGLRSIASVFPLGSGAGPVMVSGTVSRLVRMVSASPMVSV